MGHQIGYGIPEIGKELLPRLAQQYGLKLADTKSDDIRRRFGYASRPTSRIPYGRIVSSAVRYALDNPDNLTPYRTHAPAGFTVGVVDNEGLHARVATVAQEMSITAGQFVFAALIAMSKEDGITLDGIDLSQTFFTSTAAEPNNPAPKGNKTSQSYALPAIGKDVLAHLALEYKKAIDSDPSGSLARGFPEVGVKDEEIPGSFIVRRAVAMTGIENLIQGKHILPQNGVYPAGARHDAGYSHEVFRQAALKRNITAGQYALAAILAVAEKDGISMDAIDFCKAPADSKAVSPPIHDGTTVQDEKPKKVIASYRMPKIAKDAVTRLIDAYIMAAQKNTSGPIAQYFPTALESGQIQKKLLMSHALARVLKDRIPIDSHVHGGKARYTIAIHNSEDFSHSDVLKAAAEKGITSGQFALAALLAAAESDGIDLAHVLPRPDSKSRSARHDPLKLK